LKLKNFTPLFDEYIKKYGPDVANLYGKIWRYCDWSPMSKCDCSNQRLADETGLSVSSVKRCKTVLLDAKEIKKVGTGPHGVTSLAIMDEYEIGITKVGQSEPPSGSEGATPQSVDQPSVSHKDSKRPKKDLVDGILEQQQQQFFPDFPEQVMQNLREFYLMYTDASPTLPDRYNPPKQILSDWVATGMVWMEAGLQPKHVRRGFLIAQEDGISISRPGSITYAMLSVSKEDN